jgi:RNA polymerase-binding transcription factor DksA
MKTSKRVMRRIILSTLYDHLRDQYAVPYSRDIIVDGELSYHEIDALLAFKSDPRLEELRNALDRLEEGTYGICIGCKSSISQALLNRDPAQRLCSSCEQRLVSHVAHQYFHNPVTT